MTFAAFSTDKKRSALADYYEHRASPLEVEQEYYFLFADHGSSCDGMYQQWMANLMTPLRDRKRICGQIIDNYNEALATGAITDPDAPQPNMDVLRACYEASSQSVQNGDSGYALSGLKAAIKKKPRPSAYTLRRGLLLWLKCAQGTGAGGGALPTFDVPFLILLLLLLSYGLLMLFSAGYAVALYRRGDAYTYIRPQLLFAALGHGGYVRGQSGGLPHLAQAGLAGAGPVAGAADGRSLYAGVQRLQAVAGAARVGHAAAQ